METKERNQLLQIPLLFAVITGIIYLIIYLSTGEIPVVDKLILFRQSEYVLPFSISRAWDILFIFIYSFLLVRIIQYVKKRDKDALAGLGVGLLVSLVIGLGVGLGVDLETGLVYGIGVGFLIGLGVGLETGLVASLVASLGISLVGGLVFVLGGVLGGGLGVILAGGLVFVLGGVLVFGVVVSLGGGLFLFILVSAPVYGLVVGLKYLFSKGFWSNFRGLWERTIK